MFVSSEAVMRDLSAAAPGMVRQAIQVIKVTQQNKCTINRWMFKSFIEKQLFFSLQSINTLQKQAEGLCEILNMSPSHATLEVHRDVFGHGGRSDAPPPATGAGLAHGSRQPVKRAVEEAAASGCYVPLAKKPDVPVSGGGGQPE